MEIAKDLIPDNPPEWFFHWPGRESIARKFPDAIRMHYVRSKKPRVGGLSFQTDGFAAINECLPAHFGMEVGV